MSTTEKTYSLLHGIAWEPAKVTRPDSTEQVDGIVYVIAARDICGCHVSGIAVGDWTEHDNRTIDDAAVAVLRDAAKSGHAGETTIKMDRVINFEMRPNHVLTSIPHERFLYPDNRCLRPRPIKLEGYVAGRGWSLDWEDGNLAPFAEGQDESVAAAKAALVLHARAYGYEAVLTEHCDEEDLYEFILSGTQEDRRKRFLDDVRELAAKHRVDVWMPDSYTVKVTVPEVK